jgi:glycosyltransferase involved in cell wall biosynthesis
MKYSIVIPAYNEEARIADTVRDYARYIQDQLDPQQTELWLVVNGSLDRTGEIAHELERLHPFIHAWVTEQRMGKGGAVMKGFDLAQGEILAFTDADNSTVPEEMQKLLDRVEQGVDAAIGSRWLPQSQQAVPQPFSRRLASRVFNLIVRALFQFPYKDTQCGAKAFRREAIRAVREQVNVSGWAFDVALIWNLRRRGLRVEEVPIVWRDNSRSRIRMHRDAPSMLIELLKIRLGIGQK